MEHLQELWKNIEPNDKSDDSIALCKDTKYLRTITYTQLKEQLVRSKQDHSLRKSTRTNIEKIKKK